MKDARSAPLAPAAARSQRAVNPRWKRCTHAMFRGWHVAAACFLLVVVSAPSHSFGINILVPFFERDIGITHEQASYVWLIASLCSAALTPLAGAASDRYGVRATSFFVAPLYVLTLLGLSRVNSPLQLTVCVSSLRFLGADVLCMFASVTVQRWFVRNVGRASALLSFAGTLFVAMPALMSSLISLTLQGDWRRAYVSLAAGSAVLLFFALRQLRDRPEAHSSKAQR